MKGRANTATQVKALLWEESRVGGSIAGVCLAIGLLLLLVNWFQMGASAWRRDEFLVEFAAIGVPIMVALMLILNPDNSGHLVGGFSRRILRLPVETYIAVAVSLLARTFFVFVVSIALVGLSSAMFFEAPGLAAAVLIAILYLLAQLVDWLRGIVSGLSSLLVLSVIAVIAYALWPGTPELTPLAWGLSLAKRSPWVLPAGAVVGLAAAYGVSAIAVHADRIGRRYGVPEIWEWPRRVTRSRAYRASPFRSPMTAQVWFELRRSKFILPLGTVFLWALIAAAMGVYLATTHQEMKLKSWTSQASFDTSWSYKIWGARERFAYYTFFAVPLVAAAQGIQLRVSGFRRRSGQTTAYEYLRPLRDTQYATARVIASLALIVPVIAATLVLHFALAGPAFIGEMIPEAWHSGVMSFRELVWALTARGLFLALFTWPLLAIGTRLFQWILSAAVILGLFLFIWLAFDEVDVKIHAPDFGSAIMAGLVAVVMAYLLVRAYRASVVSTAQVMRLSLVWLLAAWLLTYALAVAWTPVTVSLGVRLLAYVTALGVGALGPMVYLAFLFDIHRRRHGAACQQDHLQHVSASGGALWRVAGWAAIPALVWLGWPAEPAFVSYRRERGYPVTLKELDGSYASPSAAENVAPRYLEAARQYFPEVAPFWRQWRKNTPLDPNRNPLDPVNRVALMGGETDLFGPIARDVWTETEAYWTAITQPVASQLREIAKSETSKSRYPIDLTLGHGCNPSHLNQLTGLSLELELDALRWAVNRQPERAADSIEAQYAMARSLSNEPMMFSQFVRFRIMNGATDSIERLLNRSTPDAVTLERLQRLCESALPGTESGMATDVAVIGETVMWHVAASNGINIDYSGRLAPISAGALTLSWQLFYPYAGTATAIELESAEAMRMESQNWPAALRRQQLEYESAYRSSRYFLANPVSRYNQSDYGPEWFARVRLALARLALAVERYRLVTGELPLTLDTLVPEYLSAIPVDVCALTPGSPLRYVLRETGEYWAYSIGFDPADRGGLYTSSWRGDIAFRVAPIEFRTGPQVSEN